MPIGTVLLLQTEVTEPFFLLPHNFMYYCLGIPNEGKMD